MKTTYISSIALSSVLLLGGCAATKTMIEHRHLDVQTKMSATVFLEPVAESDKTILVQIRNTSDKTDFNPKASIERALTVAGYKLVNDPNKAHYMLQANILKVGKVKRDEAQSMLASGYGTTIEGAAIGATAIGSLGNSGSAILAGGLIGAALSSASDSLVKDVIYSVVTDIRLSERLADGMQVNEISKSKLSQGTNGSQQLTSNKKSVWNRHETRVISTADKVNLKFNEAKPVLLAGLTNSISGIFG